MMPCFKNFRSAIVVVALTLPLALSGCFEKKAQAPAQAPLTQVEIVTMQLTQANILTELPGRTTAYQVAEVRPQVSGIIEKRLFEEGAEVKEGESLYIIDQSLYKAAVASAEAALKQAEANLALKQADAQRSAKLVKSNAVSKSADDSAQAELKVAQANLIAARAELDTARINLRYTEVKSPISGQVSLSEVTPGALVTANQSSRLTVVQQLDPIYVDVTQAYEVMDRMKSNLASGSMRAGAESAEVVLLLNDNQRYEHKGKLTFRDALVDESTGTVRVRALFANPDRRLFPGQYVRAIVNEGVRDKVFKLDQRATMRHTTGAPYVYVVGDGDVIESRDIEISGAEGTQWIVEKGLKAGDRVVIEGILKVRPGTKVAPVPLDDTARRAAAKKNIEEEETPAEAGK